MPRSGRWRPLRSGSSGIGARANPLVAALGDPSPLVQGSAAEALGLLGDPTAADAVGQMIARIIQSGALAETPGEDAEAARDTPAAAFRLGVCALARLNAYGPLAAAVLDASGQPRVRWWPVAYALQRLGEPRALTALLALATDPHPYTRAFAARGLGAIKDRAAVPTLLRLASSHDRAVAIEAVRSLGRIGDPEAAPALLALVQAVTGDPQLRLEAVGALAGVHGFGVNDTLLDLLSSPNPSMRAAALRSIAALDPEQFLTILSGLDPDPHWNVRATLATVLGTLAPEIGLPRLRTMLGDQDRRVIPAVLRSLVKLRAPNVTAVLLDQLNNDDPAVRAAAAMELGGVKPPEVSALALAYRFGQRDTTYIARAAALEALAQSGTAEAVGVLRIALSDKDWAVRVRAAALLKPLDPAADVDALIRPAPTRTSPDIYQARRIVEPSVSTEIFVDTDRGTIQIELAVLDAPLTVENFVTLAREGFFNGLSIPRVVADDVVQDGDPRGDGEGGPGYTIRDELSERPYLRGTVGMALDWPDTGGSQFFITHSPQPQLDAKYTVFGRVIAGMEVVDQLQQWDVIRRVRVWDGETMK